MRQLVFLLITVFLLAGCSVHKDPVKKNSLEYLGHVRGTFGGYWGCPDGGYSSAISRAFSNIGIPAALAISGASAPQLQTLEPKLKAFALKCQATYERQPNAASLIWNTKAFFPSNGVRGIRPDVYGVLYALAELLNQDPNLLVLVYSHDPQVSYNPVAGLIRGQKNAHDFLVALCTASGIDKKRFSSFGSAHGKGETLALTLLPREFVSHYGERL